MPLMLLTLRWLLPLLLVLHCATETAGSVLVHRQIETDAVFAVGNPITVRTTIYHVQGDSAASDLVLKDDWPSEFFDISGELETSFAHLGVGKNISHAIVVTPTKIGQITIAPSILTYKLAASDAERQVQSTQLYEPISIVSAEKYAKLKDNHVFEYSVLGGSVFVTVVLPLLAMLQTTFFYTHGVPNRLLAKDTSKKNL